MPGSSDPEGWGKGGGGGVRVMIELGTTVSVRDLMFSRSNVLKLNIFYEELNYEFIREERSYEVISEHLLKGNMSYLLVCKRL